MLHSIISLVFNVDARIAAIVFLCVFLIVITYLASVRPYYLLLFMLLSGTIRIDGLFGIDRFFSDPQTGLGGFSLDGVRLIAIVILLVALFASRLNTLPASMVPISLLLFISYAFLSLLWTRLPIEGIRLILKMLYPLLIMWTIVGSVQSPRQARQVINVILASLVINIGLGVLSNALGAGKLPGGPEGVLRQGTILLPPSALALFLSTGVLVALTCFMESRRYAYLFLSLAGLVQLVFTYQRMAWLMFLVGVVVYAFLSRRLSIKLVALITIFITALAPFVVPSFGARFFLGTDPGASLQQFLSNPISSFQLLNTSGRFEIYNLVISNLIVPRPFFGWGVGTFQYATAKLFSLGVGDGWRLLVDLGAMGLMLYAVFIASLIWRIYRLGLSLDRERHAIAALAIAVLVQYSLSFITDNPIECYDLFAQYVFAITALALIWSRWGNSRQRTPNVRLWLANRLTRRLQFAVNRTV